MKQKEILTTFARNFVNKPFRDRFVHESLKKPVDLHRRICHEIEKVFDHKYKNNNHTFEDSESCIFLGWFRPIKELAWKEAEKIMAEGGGGYLVINTEGTKFYAETEAYPSEKYAGSS